MLDFHNHVIPGVDDGAGDVAEARAALASLQAAGVEAVIATPHLDASLTHRAAALAARLAEIDAGWATLTQLRAREFPELRLLRGVELMLDVPDPELEDPRLRLAGTRFVLIEFPMMSVPPGSVRVLGRLVAQGWAPIIAHPERYRGLDGKIELAGQWRDAGACLQVNSGSLIGRYGPGPRRVAFALLERGWADYLASDYHARGQPTLREAHELLVERGADEHAQLLLRVNPLRIPEEGRPLPVPPLPGGRAGLLGRLVRVFR